MIDISIVKAGSYFYSVKTSIKFNSYDKSNAKIIILNIDLVEQNGLTTLKKLKNIFSNENNKNNLNKLKYGELFKQISYTLANKYKIKTLEI